jgi:NAD(P)-dependent dehydrogenase (short-subunit alcohol dehydrogenase family)
LRESLKGREVLLAGGAGGLGSAIALLLLAEGARVVLSFRGNRAPPMSRGQSGSFWSQIITLPVRFCVSMAA